MSLLSLSQLDLDIYYVFHQRHRILTVNFYLFNIYIYCHLLISTPVDITGLVCPR